MPKAVAYLRVSSDKQAEEGIGLEAQNDACHESAKKLGLPLVPADIHTDAGISGTTPLASRPALLDAIASLESGDVLLVARRDRLGRDVVNVCLIEREVKAKGSRVVSAAGEASDVEGPGGELIRVILDAVSAHERAVLSLRVRAAVKAKKARGGCVGQVPYGMILPPDPRPLDRNGKRIGRDERVMVRDESPEVAQGLRVLRYGRVAGVSYAALAKELNVFGVKAHGGAAWRASATRSVCMTNGIVKAGAVEKVEVTA